MADLLAISSRIIDSGVVDQPVNRTTSELSEIGDGIAVVESFSHSVLFRTDEGVVAFDASGPATGTRVVDAIRGWTQQPVSTIVYTHGHIDHVGGSGAFAADAEARGRARPQVIAHEAVAPRFDRYRYTNGYNNAINQRQFGWQRNRDVGIAAAHPEQQFLPVDTLQPDRTYAEHLDLSLGGLQMELHHGRGETDDHTWAWLPEHRAVCVGDFLIWNFPNAGNPQKVQRFPGEWAAALRAMVAKGPELLLPAHGLPIEGRDRIATVLTTVATALEDLLREVVDMMNAGATLDTIVHSVTVPAETLAKPYLRPLYDDPEFVVRNIWRLYGGWWDGDPATLKPAPKQAVAEELARLAGGPRALAQRADELRVAGDLRLAGELATIARRADPHDDEVARVHHAVYSARKAAETSLMAKGIFAGAAKESAPPA